MSIPAILLAGYAIAETLRFTRAEQLSRMDTVEALQAALEITPRNADYYARIATLDSSQDGQLRAALALNSRNPSWWIMLSVRQEQDGDVAAAEKSLLQANLVSRYFTPRWSLAAFYYRQGDKTEFVKWAKSALSTGNGEAESLFKMAQRLNLTSSQLLNELLPDVPPIVDSYLHLLLQEGKVEQQQAVAGRLIRIGSVENRGSVLEASESLFIAGQIDQAVDLWNTVIRARWTDRSPVTPWLGESVGNDSFAQESLERGFDWKNSIPSGVSTFRSVPDRSLCFEFSGSQPEKCELMGKFVPLLPKRQYQLKIRYRLRCSPSESGLMWSVLSVPSDKPLMSGLLKVSAEFAEQSFPFETPPQNTPARILLSYSRLPGTTRIEGALSIQSVQLMLLP